MKAYWDASALLALIFDEPHTEAAVKARSVTAEIFAWSWLGVELAAGCARRRANARQRATADHFLARAFWHELLPSDYSAVAARNETWRLRAADAGHLFAFQRLARVDPMITLVCFDRELTAAARAEKLRVWSRSR